MKINYFLIQGHCQIIPQNCQDEDHLGFLELKYVIKYYTGIILIGIVHLKL